MFPSGSSQVFSLSVDLSSVPKSTPMKHSFLNEIPSNLPLCGGSEKGQLHEGWCDADRNFRRWALRATRPSCFPKRTGQSGSPCTWRARWTSQTWSASCLRRDTGSWTRRRIQQRRKAVWCLCRKNDQQNDENGLGEENWMVTQVPRNMRRMSGFWWARGDKQTTDPWAKRMCVWWTVTCAWHEKKLFVCVALSAYDEVFCLHTLSRARHSLMSVREMFKNDECARFSQKNWWINERL